jgi:LmbE family N-acetylglucosaminyl deacetylase
MSRMASVRVALDRATRPVALAALPLPPGSRAVVLAPHPDDFDAIGVTLRRLHECGHRIEVGVLTGAASGVEDGYRGVVTPAAKRDLREAEQRASCRLFGLPDDRLTFLRLEEDESGHLVSSAANRQRLRTFLLSQAPELAFLPHGNDTNADHQRAAAFFRDIAGDCHEPILAFFNRDPKTLAMRTDLITGFGEDAASWKGGLLRCHGSQHQRNLNTRGHGFDERVLGVNRQIAADLGSVWPYAESFEVEWVGGSR